MAGIYRPRRAEKMVLNRVLFHFFDQFISEYEDRFEKEYGYFRPVIREVQEKYIDCGNPKNGFARIRGCNHWTGTFLQTYDTIRRLRFT